MDQLYANEPEDALQQLSGNELFRKHLEEQIAQQKKIKYLQKMKEIEEEINEQERVQKELEIIQSNHLKIHRTSSELHRKIHSQAIPSLSSPFQSTKKSEYSKIHGRTPRVVKGVQG